MKTLKDNQPNYQAIICLYLVAAVLSLNNGVNALLSKIMLDYPELPATTVRLLSNIVNVLSTAVSLIVGPFIGKKIGFKPVTLCGLFLCLIGGVAPMFFVSFAIILAARIIYGIGVGLLVCRSGYIMLLAAKGTEAKLNSDLLVVFNFAGVAFTLIIGVIGDINWRYGFLLFALAIIPLLLGFKQLKEPQLISQEESTSSENVKKETLSAQTWVYAVFMFIVSLTSVIWMVGISQLMVEKGIVNSSQVSLVISAVQLGSVFSGIVFNSISKRNIRLLAPITALANCLACLIATLTTSLYVLMLVGAMAGCGYILGMIMCTSYAGLCNTKANSTIATIIVTASSTAGVFATGYYIAFCSNFLNRFLPQISYTACAFAFSAVMLAVIAIITYIIDLSPKNTGH